MSAAVELTDALIAAGMSPGQAATLLARAAAEINAPTRSKGALRTERWRHNKASQTVTERHAVTPETPSSEASQSVTNRHKASPRDGAHISKENKRDIAPASQRASRLPEDWTLDERHIGYALAKGMHRSRIDDVAEKFKNHWLSKSGRGATAVNWYLKWCTWVMNDIEWSAVARNGKPAPRNPLFEGIT